MTEKRLKYLISKWEANQLTATEETELNEWFLSDYKDFIPQEEQEALKEDLLQHYLQLHPHKEDFAIPVQHMYPWRWIAAAAMVIIFSVLGWHFFNEHKSLQKTISTVADVLPGGNHAVLTLANGQQIVLDSAGNGNVANQNGVQVIKLDSGQLAYEGNSTAVSFNTLSTPRGGQYQIILPDGSKVWLNSASSLKYPTAFIGTERKIELSGEAYFEVAHNPKRPFIVSSENQTVTVLGTHFNINSYNDEHATTTTLLEGRVSVSSNNHQVILKPGYAALQKQGQINTEKANIDQAIAWKDGVLDMDGQSFDAIMRQISRWYNVDIVYEGKVPDVKLAGQMDKGLNLSQLLKGLEMMHVHFKIEGRKLIVR